MTATSTAPTKISDKRPAAKTSPTPPPGPCAPPAWLDELAEQVGEQIASAVLGQTERPSRETLQLETLVSIEDRVMHMQHRLTDLLGGGGYGQLHRDLARLNQELIVIQRGLGLLRNDLSLAAAGASNRVTVAVAELAVELSETAPAESLVRDPGKDTPATPVPAPSVPLPQGEPSALPVPSVNRTGTKAQRSRRTVAA